MCIDTQQWWQFRVTSLAYTQPCTHAAMSMSPGNSRSCTHFVTSITWNLRYSQCIVNHRKYLWRDKIKLHSEIQYPFLNVQFIGVEFKQSLPVPILVIKLMHTSVAYYLEQYTWRNRKFLLSPNLFILQDLVRALALVYLHSQIPPIVRHDLANCQQCFADIEHDG